MMLRLYKFTCPGNYPVCKGIVIFAVDEYLTWDTGQELCAKLAKECGIINFHKCDGVQYLGTFMPATEPNALPYVIHAENGEY
jgi:hypothetical protein